MVKFELKAIPVIKSIEQLPSVGRRLIIKIIADDPVTPVLVTVVVSSILQVLKSRSFVKMSGDITSELLVEP